MIERVQLSILETHGFIKPIVLFVADRFNLWTNTSMKTAIIAMTSVIV